MSVAPILENYKRRNSIAENESSISGNRLWLSSEDLEKRKRRRQCKRPPCSRSFMPWASMVSLVVTWTGLFLFCWKMYFGLIDMENITGGWFKEAAYYLRMAREIILLAGILMAALTGIMLIIGFCATLNCELSYRGRFWGCFCSVLGNRVLCGFFWLLGYVFNVFWLAVLSALVLMTSAYFCFLPICLPQAGTVDQLCFNFTLIAAAIGGEAMSASALSLLLCGGPIDKFCKLTKAIVPWYWGAYAGCVLVLNGLSQFNGCLAANFAHVLHAARYRRIRARTKGRVKWTANWRIKSVLVNPNSKGTVSTVSQSFTQSGSRKANGFLPSRSDSDSDSNESDSSVTGFEAEPYFDVGERQRLAKDVGLGIPRTTSTGSIVLQKCPVPNRNFTYNNADTVLYNSDLAPASAFP